MQQIKETSTNSAIDVIKLIMSVLVVGIHAELFGFNIWLDRGFGIITRLCVPFFFIASAYFFFKGNKPLIKHIERLTLLYIIWSIFYLPFDFVELKSMSLSAILNRYLWTGNGHALWYLQGSVIGTLIIYGLRKMFSTRIVCAVSFGLLTIGCLFSTYAPLVKRFAGGDTLYLCISAIGTRNGLFYSPAYIALGLYFSERKQSVKRRKLLWGLLVLSLILLAIESIIFVIVLDTTSTVLWLSVYPASFSLFLLIVSSDFRLSKRISVWIRELSTCIYVMHGLFIIAFRFMGYGVLYFAATLSCSILLGIMTIFLSRRVKCLKYLY